MRAIAGLGLMLTLVACGHSVEDVQDSPVAFTMQVPAAWDSVGTCIAAHYVSDTEALYLPVASQQRAKVIVKYVGQGVIQYRSILFVFDISGGPETTVVVRQSQSGLLVSPERGNRITRDVVERCGKV